MAISAVSSYSPAFDYQSWVDNANTQAKALEARLASEKADSTSESSTAADSTSGSSAATDSTSKSTSTSSSSASMFVLSYKSHLKNLESASEKLRVSSSGNVFSKYETALTDLSRAETDEDKKTAQEAVDKAKADIVSAVKEFADQYNNTISFLADNEGRSSTVSRHLSSLQRGMLTQDALQTVGLSLDASGRLQVDEKKLNEALDQNVDFAKNTLGSQFGIAERVGEKATYILDYASPESVAGVSGLSSGSNDISSIDYMKLFAGYTRSGAYNLSNFYAVGMFLNTFA